jgi:hypothetical protein
VIGRLEVGDLEAEVLCAEVFLHAKHHWEGDPTQGVDRLAKHDAEERLIILCQPLEVEVHLLQDVDEDEVEPASSIDEGLREQGALDNEFDDQRVRPGI